MRKILTNKFFESDGKKVAMALLGKFLVRRHYMLIHHKSTSNFYTHLMSKKFRSRTNKRITRRIKDFAFMITDVEVYDGHKDKASQASRGRTERNSPMFGPAGYTYVYFTYGMHWMLNIVTGKEGYPSAVLIRGAGEYDGPAKLTKALKIDKRLNNQKLSKKSGLWIENRENISKKLKVKSKKIIRTPRIGIRSAGPIWEKKKLRFVLLDSIK